MLADRGDQSFECGLLTLLQASDILVPELVDPHIAAALDPVLEACDILTDLINHGQLLGEWHQPGIGSCMDLPHRCGADCDKSGIDLIVLGPLQVELGIGSALTGLEPTTTNRLRRSSATTGCS